MARNEAWQNMMDSFSKEDLIEMGIKNKKELKETLHNMGDAVGESFDVDSVADSVFN